MKRPRLVACLAMLLIAAPCVAQDGKSSPPEERAHWVEVLHQLEVKPLDPGLRVEAEKVFKRLVAVSDFHIVLCDVLSEVGEMSYKDHEPVIQLFALGLAAYQIETGRADNAGANLYALHSVLKGYAAILVIDPQATDKRLNHLVKVDGEGKLPELIKKKGCK